MEEVILPLILPLILLLTLLLTLILRILLITLLLAILLPVTPRLAILLPVTPLLATIPLFTLPLLLPIIPILLPARLFIIFRHVLLLFIVHPLVGPRLVHTLLSIIMFIHFLPLLDQKLPTFLRNHVRPLHSYQLLSYFIQRAQWSKEPL